MNRAANDVDGTDRAIANAIRVSRDYAIAACIEVVREFVKTGDCSEGCVRALEDLRAMLPKPPSAGN